MHEHPPRHSERDPRGTTELIVHLTQAITSNLDLPQVIQAVTESGTQLSGASVGAFLYGTGAPGPRPGDAVWDTHPDPGYGTGRAPDAAAAAGGLRRVVTGTDAAVFTALDTNLTEALFAPALYELETVRAADLAADARFCVAAAVPWRSLISAPVIGGQGDLIGALVFGHPAPGRFDQTAEAYVRAVAAHAAVAVENARLFAAERAARRGAEESAAVMAWLQHLTAALAGATTVPQTLAALEEAFASGPRPHCLRVLVEEPGGLRDLGEDTPPPWLAAVTALEASPLRDALDHDRPLEIRSAADLEVAYPQARALLPHLEAVLLIPFRSDQTRGVLAAAWPAPADPIAYGEATLRSVGHQLASTLERVRLFEAEAAARRHLRDHVEEVTAASRTLQRSLLPQELPVVEGLGVAARYRPGDAGAEVGGDWYDLVLGSDGRATFVIGDVEGHSFSAAAVMGRVSSALRAYLSEGHPLDVALSRVNPLVDAADVLATCTLLTLDPRTGEMEWVRAGHPLPLLQLPGDATPAPAGSTDEWGPQPGRAGEVLVAGGPPLGLPGGTWPVTRHRVAPGTRVLLYTDGLTERRREPADLTALLAAQMTAGAGLRLDVMVDHVLGTVAADATDDVALLAVELLGAPERPTARMSLASARDVAAARGFVLATLDAWGCAELGDAATLVASELCTNAVRHGGGAGRLELTLEETGVRVAVYDNLAQAPRVVAAAEDDLSGRGMMLVDALASAWASEPNGDGKVVWALLDCDGS